MAAATLRDTASQEESGNAASSGDGGPVTIVASVPPTDHGWLGAISKNAEEAAEQFDDVDFRLLEAADSDSQAQQIEQVISDKPDALVVLPQDGEALTPVAQKAENAGIPVINVDRLFSAPDAATATILGDNYQIGVSAADYISEELNCKGKVVEIQGLAGISVTEERTKGFTDQLKKVCPDGGIEIVAKQPGDFNPDTGLKVMENILQAQDQIDAVYTHDDDMAQGVVQAIRNAGREDEMFLTGVGGSQDAMAQIKEGGLYRATFLYNPAMAASAVNMARLIALGEGFSELVPPEVPRQVIVPAATVTQENMADYEEYAFDSTGALIDAVGEAPASAGPPSAVDALVGRREQVLGVLVEVLKALDDLRSDPPAIGLAAQAPVVEAGAGELFAGGRGRLPAAQEELEPGVGTHLPVGGLLHREHILDGVLLVEEPLALGEEVAQPVEAPPAVAALETGLEVVGEQRRP